MTLNYFHHTLQPLGQETYRKRTTLREKIYLTNDYLVKTNPKQYQIDFRILTNTRNWIIYMKIL